MFNRIKQIFNYLFSHSKVNDFKEIKSILSPKEYEIFLKMDNYDKIHSYGVFKDMTTDKILKNNILYLKLALLHDCGKENITLFRRIKKVILGDSLLEKHPQLGYEKMKKINMELAKLIKDHHNKNVNKEMKRFQEIDDRN